MTSLLPTTSAKPILSESKQFLSLFDDFILKTVADGDVSDDTIKTYRSNLRQYLWWCDHNEISPLHANRTHLKEYRRWLIDTQNYSCATVGLKLSVVRRFYDSLIEMDYVLNNPAWGLKPPRQKQDPAARINYLQADEMYQLLDSLPTDESVASLRDRLLVEIMVLQGCRTVEMNRLSVGDIVREGDNVGLRVQAKGSIRVVPLTPEISALLQKYLNARRRSGENLTKEQPIFISLARGSMYHRLSRRSIQRIVDKYLSAIGLKDFSVQKAEATAQKTTCSHPKNPYPPVKSKKRRYQPVNRRLSAHSLRHTAGTLSLRAGASLRQVQDLLGHSDPRTTVIYAHIADRWQNNPALLLQKRFL